MEKIAPIIVEPVGMYRDPANEQPLLAVEVEGRILLWEIEEADFIEGAD